MSRLLIAVLLMLAAPAHALDWQESAPVGRLFDAAGVRGTFVLYDPAAGHLIGHDEARARTRFVPASTFKIPNSLIGLATGAVASVDQVLPYGGQPQPYPAWERDMGLREAIAVSAVPIYQELARRIGPDRMRRHVDRLGYGNARVGDAVDRFWLDGPLTISAVEQAQFLARLAQGELPYPPELQATVRELVRLERIGEATLYGKTGWVNAPGPGVGWWVGWVEKGGAVYPFALNIDIRTAADADRRVPLAKSALAALGVL